jgi:hypothetical protein
MQALEIGNAILPKTTASPSIIKRVIRSRRGPMRRAA